MTSGTGCQVGLLDEIQIALVPLLLGGGVLLFEHIGGPVRLEKDTAVDAPGVTHLRYRVGGAPYLAGRESRFAV